MLIYLAYSNKPLRLPDRDRKLPNMNGLGKKKKDEIKQKF